MLHFATDKLKQSHPTRTDFLLNMTKSNVKNEFNLPLVLVVVSPLSGLHKMTAFGFHILLTQTFAVNLTNHQISQDILKPRDYGRDAIECTLHVEWK
jgi:hypothetical protein